MLLSSFNFPKKFKCYLTVKSLIHANLNNFNVKRINYCCKSYLARWCMGLKIRGIKLFIFNV
jgi:hypothetical protein